MIYDHTDLSVSWPQLWCSSGGPWHDRTRGSCPLAAGKDLSLNPNTSLFMQFQSQQLVHAEINVGLSGLSYGWMDELINSQRN